MTSTGPDSSPDLTPDELFLQEFSRDYQAAPSAEAQAEVLARFLAGRPDLASQLRDRAAVLARLSTAMPGRLGEYLILRRLGTGGMGEIYLAVHPRLERLVAIKVIRPDRSDRATLDRFQREQRALARLHHTHIVPIYAAGEEGTIRYFVMPFIAGTPLDEVVRAARRGRAQAPGDGPSAERFRSVARAIADAAGALHHAHEAAVLHRDLKPSNLILDRSGHCWVIDFGLAWIGPRRSDDAAEAPDGTVASGDGGLTQAGTILGSHAYIAPEQWLTGRADPRTDVWGLGVTLYELLTLRQAFAAPVPAPSATTVEAGQDRPGDYRERILHGEVAPPRAVEPSVPADLEAICLKALRKDPVQRYASAADLADDLRRWLRGEPTQARPAGAPRRAWLWSRRNPGWAASLLLAIVGLLTATGLTVRSAQVEADRQRAEAALLAVEVIRLKPRIDGWRDRAWDHLRAAVARRPGPDLNDAGAALLDGLDATRLKTLPPDNYAAVAVDADARRLLLAGAKGDRTRVWDRATDRVVPFGHPSDPGKVAFGQDRRPLALAPTDGPAIALWDLEKQQVIRRFEFPAEPGQARPTAVRRAGLDQPILALSEQAGRVAAAADGPDGPVVVWDGATGKELARFRAAPTALALSAAGEFLAAAGADGRVTVWSVRQPKEVVATLQTSPFQVHALAFSPDADRDAPARPVGRLAVCGGSARVVLWDLAGRLPTDCLGSHHEVHAVAFNPDGTLLASGGRGFIKLWDAATGRHLLDIDAGDNVTGVAFSPDGAFLASSNRTAQMAGRPGVWALHDGRGVRTLRGLKSLLALVEFSRDGRLLAGLSHDWRVGIWDAATGRLLHQRGVAPGTTVDNAGLAFSSDGRRLAVATGSEAKVWDTTTGKEERAWPLPRAVVNRPLFDADDTKLLLFRCELPGEANKAPHRPVVYDLLRPNGAAMPLYEIDGPTRILTAVAAHAPGRFILQRYGGPDEKNALVEVIRAATGERVWRRPHFVPPRGFGTLALDASLQVVGVMDEVTGTSRLLDLATGQDRRHLPLLAAGLGLGGDRYVHGTESRDTGALVLTLRYAETGENDRAAVRLGLNGHPVHQAIRFGPQGTHLAWGNQDGTVSVCDLAAVREQLAGLKLGW